VILADAGPLVALIERRDTHHARCVSAAARVVGPMLTTWPVFTEAVYLLGRSGGWHSQQQLWRQVRAGGLVLDEVTPAMLTRMYALMERYQDLPMDLADASLVALAEERRMRQVFTVDNDFRVYRLPGGDAFELIPSI
jgi:uncharacterized protein